MEWFGIRWNTNATLGFTGTVAGFALGLHFALSSKGIRAMNEQFLLRYDIYWNAYLAHPECIRFLTQALFWRCAAHYGKSVALRLYPV